MRDLDNYSLIEALTNQDKFSNPGTYAEYKNLYYEVICINFEKFYAKVFGIAELETEKFETPEECIAPILYQIDNYIYQYSKNGIRHPTPIPEYLSRDTELYRLAKNYFLRKEYTCNIINAIKFYGLSNVLSRIISNTNIYTKNFEYEIYLYKIFCKKKIDTLPYEIEKINANIHMVMPILYNNNYFFSDDDRLKIFVDKEKLSIMIHIDCSKIQEKTVLRFQEKSDNILIGYWHITIIKEKGNFFYNIINPKGNSLETTYMPCISIDEYINADTYISKIPLDYNKYSIELFKYQLVALAKFADHCHFDEEAISNFFDNLDTLKIILKNFILVMDRPTFDKNIHDNCNDETYIKNAIRNIEDNSILVKSDLNIIKEVISKKMHTEEIRILAEIAYWKCISKKSDDEETVFYSKIAILKLNKMKESDIFDAIFPDEDHYNHYAKARKIKTKKFNDIQNKSQFINYRIKCAAKIAKKDNFPTQLSKNDTF